MSAITRLLNSHRYIVYANVVLLFFLLNGVAAKAGCRLELTRGGVNSLTASSERVFSGLTQPLIIEAYISQDIPAVIQPDIFNLVNQLREVGRAGGSNVRLTITSPESDETRQQAEGRGVRGLPLEQRTDAEATVKLGYFGIYLQLGEKSELVDLVDNSVGLVQDLEYRLLSAVKRMSRPDDAKSGIGFVVAPGAGGLSPPQSRNDLSKDNFYSLKLMIEEDQGNLEEVTLAGPVPSTIEVLILAGLPRLEPLEQYYLDQFLMGGGNLIVMARGFDFQIQQADPRLQQFGGGGGGLGFASIPAQDLQSFNEWLGRYGVVVQGGLLFEGQNFYTVEDFLYRFINSIPYPLWAYYRREEGNITGNHPAVAPLQQIILPWFSALDLREATQPGVEFRELIRSSPYVFRKENTGVDFQEVIDAVQSGTEPFLNQPATLAVLASGKFQSAFGPETLPAGADVTRFRPGQVGDSQGNLVVVGTPYLVSDIMFRTQSGLTAMQINRAFILNLLEVFIGDNDLLEARSRVRGFAQLKLWVQESEGFQRVITYLFVVGLPLGLALYGFVRLRGRAQRRGLEDAADSKTEAG